MHKITKEAFSMCAKKNDVIHKDEFHLMMRYINEWLLIWRKFRETDKDKNYRLDLKEWKETDLHHLFDKEDYGTSAKEKFSKIDRNRSGSLTADEVLWESTRRISKSIKDMKTCIPIIKKKIENPKIEIKPIMSTEDIIKLRTLEMENKKLKKQCMAK